MDTRLDTMQNRSKDMSMESDAANLLKVFQKNEHGHLSAVSIKKSLMPDNVSNNSQKVMCDI